VWDNQSQPARRYELLVTLELDGQDRKYSLTKTIDLDSASKLDAEATILGLRDDLRMGRASAEWRTTRCGFGMRGIIIWRWR
jgi:hypothetical protein